MNRIGHLFLFNVQSKISFIDNPTIFPIYFSSTFSKGLISSLLHSFSSARRLFPFLRASGFFSGSSAAPCRSHRMASGKSGSPCRRSAVSWRRPHRDCRNAIIGLPAAGLRLQPLSATRRSPLAIAHSPQPKAHLSSYSSTFTSINPNIARPAINESPRLLQTEEVVSSLSSAVSLDVSSASLVVPKA